MSLLGDLWDEAKDAASDAADAIGDAAEEVGDALGGAAEDAGEAIGDAAEDIFGSAEEVIADVTKILTETTYDVFEEVGNGLLWVGDNFGDEIVPWVKDTLDDYSEAIAAGVAAAATGIATGLFGGASDKGNTGEGTTLPPVAETEPIGDTVGQGLESSAPPYHDYVDSGLMTAPADIILH